MKKLLLSLSLALATLSAPTWATTLDGLDFKNVMRGLYAGKMTNCVVDDETLESYPHVCLDEMYDPDMPELSTLALMHPVMSFDNQNGQKRHLLMIEKVALDKGVHLSGHVGSAKADLYLFKKTGKGYELISRNTKNEEMAGSWGRVHLDLNDIKSSIQPFGKGLMGAMFESGYCSTGSCETYWYALMLPEHGDIKTVFVADAGSNNGGMHEETHPLYYGYESTYQVMPNGSAYYPIQIHYTGERPDDDYERIYKVNETITFYFDKQTNTYTKRQPIP
ncbi:MAG: hypothetical protein Q3971_05295 [Moraxella sp.]|nr:hypothetical protein [Moraxella sp.]